MTESNESNKLQSPEGSVLVLVCTYNERNSLPHLFERIKEHSDSPILVIDDDSPDGTSQWVAEMVQRDSKIKLITRGGKLGLGSAIILGLKYAVEQGFDAVVNLDADLSHDPKEIPKLIDAAKDSQTPFDLVIGSRYVAGGGMANCSWRRHLVSRCANFYARRLLGVAVRDCSSAFRLYRTDALKSLDMDAIRCSGYGMLEEILFALCLKGKRVKEVPITYTERRSDRSKLSIREALGTFSVINRLFLGRFAWRTPR